ncbi:MAG: hypothetical protein WC087_00175 [Candidatus Paceibacterota bacterium]
MSTIFTKKDGFQAIVLLGKLCQEILATENCSKELHNLATESANFIQQTQDKMIDAGSINPARMDCHSKDNPIDFFVQQFGIEEFVGVCSTERARLAGARLRQHADQIGA